MVWQRRSAAGGLIDSRERAVLVLGRKQQDKDQGPYSMAACRHACSVPGEKRQLRLRRADGTGIGEED